jgi:hypothetical protein
MQHVLQLQQQIQQQMELIFYYPYNQLLQLMTNLLHFHQHQ